MRLLVWAKNMLSLADEQIERAEREAEEEQARRGSGRGEKPAVKTRATIACGERLDGVTPPPAADGKGRGAYPAVQEQRSGP